jgi:dCMP deaminase
MRKIDVVIYLPALHKGFYDFIVRNEKKVRTIFLISEQFVQEVDPELAALFEKDLRAMPALLMQKALAALNLCENVTILDRGNLKKVKRVAIPDDDVVERVMGMFYPSIELERDTSFLRWGKKTVLSQRAPIGDAVISIGEFEKDIMMKCFRIAEKSSDWWRQVGAIVFPLGHDPIESINRHLPHEQAPYINGDPRSVFKPGENIDLSTAIHAEAGAIAYAAKMGISLYGASIFITTFPCPPCAWSIREAGIKTVYYCEGYSLLTAAEVLKAAGIKLIFVDVPK